ncbi:MAG: hypothetical protein AAGI91_13320 [Bacteroidota bacterium]
MPKLSPLDRLMQTAARAYVEDALGSEDWLTVYGRAHGPLSDGLFSALVPSDRIEGVLRRPGWDLDTGTGLIGFNQAGDEPTYHRWLPSGGVEPFVIVREFHADVPGAQLVELVEEFRLLFNLAYVPRDEVYLDVSTGTPKPVARWRDGRMEVKRKRLRQFLAVKGMHLALFFDRRQHEPGLDIGDVPDGAHDVRIERDDLTYELNVRDATEGLAHRTGTFSRLVGKRLVSPLPIEACGVWPYEDEDESTTFVVGVDGDGRPVERRADPDDPAHFLDLVHFRREVLTKYYADSTRYRVDDGRVHCGALWGLPIDNDHDGKVVAYLGDLGRLPADEQLYWRAFNVEPDGGISETAFRRDVMAEFADPTEPGLAFRQAHERANRAWESALGWPLYLPLAADDQHNLDGLRVPLNDGAAEFDGQVQALAKAAVDSLNEKRVRKAAIAVGHEYEGGEAGIAKLVAYLDVTGFDVSAHGLDRSPTDWMKDVQWLRSSGSAHRKGSTYAKAAEHFDLEALGRAAVMHDLLTEGRSALDALADHAGNVARRARTKAA